MELFSLLAKLTLDSKEYDKGIKEAENAGRDIHIADPELGIDKSEFDAGIADAESTEIDDLDSPELDLDKEPFDTEVEEAEATEVDDPEEPELGLDTTDFNDGLSEAEVQGGLFKDSLSSVFEELSGVLVATGIVAVVGGLVSTLKDGVELAKNTGDAIHKQSAFMGLTTKAYQEWDYALNLSGASVTDLTRGMRNFQQIMAGDTTEKQADALGRLGINMNEVKDAEDLMTKSMYALADYTGSDKDWIAKQLFGNNYTKFARLLESGSEGIKQMREEAEGLGFVMTDEEIQNAADYMDATTRLDLAVQGLKTSLVSDILPILTDVTNKIAYFVAFFSGRTGTKSFTDGLKDSDDELARELVTIEGTGDAAMEMVDKLYQMGDAQKLNAEQQAEWKQTAQWLIENIPTLSEKINLDTLEIDGNREAIKANIAEWKALAKQRALAEIKEKKYAEFQELNSNSIDKLATARAKENEQARQQATAVATANKLLKENALLRERFGADAIDMAGDINEQLANVEELLFVDYEETGENLALSQYKLMSDANSALDQAAENARQARSEYDAVAEEYEKASKAYEDWVTEIDAMYAEAQEEEAAAKKGAEEYRQMLARIPRNVHTVLELERHETQPRSFAIGSSYIPYDMPAYLHRGEEIRTATAVRRGDNNGQVSTDFEDRVIAAIREGMADANVTAFVTDRQVARGSNRYNGNELDSRRFVP